ncbi:hypothetical protein vBPpSSYP_105 [Pseudomonas phage vB_PpS_SYP]|nr:hypothetical protein vBPpSSYP_105 [Pseudomonas phage vB_PpS_SYP]
MGKVHYEQASVKGVGTEQSAKHYAIKVNQPKSRKRGRGFVQVSK